MFDKEPERVSGRQDQIPFEQVVFAADQVERLTDISELGDRGEEEDIDRSLEYLSTGAIQCGLSRDHVISFSRFDSPDAKLPPAIIKELLGKLVRVGMSINFQDEEMVVLGLSGWMIDSDPLAESKTKRRFKLGDMLPDNSSDLILDQIELAPTKFFDMGGY
ncbi:MAG: hypothetical protein KDD64_05960 [Bdellovibrionales bacterium]|nr:hypothetical protein [Bdellovibrionales bacterium]